MPTLTLTLNTTVVRVHNTYFLLTVRLFLDINSQFVILPSMYLFIHIIVKIRKIAGDVCVSRYSKDRFQNKLP